MRNILYLVNIFSNQYIKNIILNKEYFVQQDDRVLKPMNILKFYFILHHYKFILKKNAKRTKTLIINPLLIFC